MVKIVTYKPESKDLVVEAFAERPKAHFKYLPNLNMGIYDCEAADKAGSCLNSSVSTIQAVEDDQEVHALFVKEKYNPSANLNVRDIFEDDNEATWGIQAIDADWTTYSGKGIKVCILDTGFDKDHIDFKGRKITTASFVPGESAMDGHGHGTHCIGTACGYKDQKGRRYGVAYESEIISGKVLSNRGSGSMAGILEGIDWALGQGAKIISMSLGDTSSQPRQAYEEAARRAMEKGCLIIAAAGNHRPGTVGSPANSPSVVAVGAIDSKLELAYFSCGSGSAEGAQVSVVAPGVAVYSSIPGNKYATWNGTSMATPHAAGVAALLWQQNPKMSPQQLRKLLEESAYELEIPEVDQGTGLVMAPMP